MRSVANRRWIVLYGAESTRTIVFLLHGSKTRTDLTAAYTATTTATTSKSSAYSTHPSVHSPASPFLPPTQQSCFCVVSQDNALYSRSVPGEKNESGNELSSLALASGGGGGGVQPLSPGDAEVIVFLNKEICTRVWDHQQVRG